MGEISLRLLCHGKKIPHSNLAHLIPFGWLHVAELNPEHAYPVHRLFIYRWLRQTQGEHYAFWEK
jgi:hypothetical protein